MGTHGRIVIRGKGDQTHRLYTTHDGHTRDAVRDLVALPFLLHDTAVRYSDRVHNRDRRPEVPFPEMRFWGGPFHVWIMRDIGRYKTYEDVRSMFRSALPVELSCSVLAHWVCAMYSSRWHVVWERSQTSYWAGGGATATIEDDDYIVRGDDLDDCYEAVSDIDDRQKDFPAEHRASVDEELEGVYVPFTSLMMRLAHQYIREKSDGQEKEAAHE